MSQSLNSFVSAAQEGIECTLLQDDGTCSSKIPIKLTLDKGLQTVVLHTGVNSQKQVLFEVPLHTAGVYGYYKLQSLLKRDQPVEYPVDATLKLIKEEDRHLCVMLMHGQKLLTIGVKDSKGQQEMLKSLVVLTQRAKHVDRALDEAMCKLQCNLDS